MDERRIRLAHLLGLGGSLVALAALWMPWYVIRLPRELHEPVTRMNAWQAFSGADVLLALTAVLVAAVLIAAPRLHRDVVSQVAAWGGAAMAGEAVWKLVNPPVMGEYASPSTGAWVALIAAVAICAGGCAAAASASSELRRTRGGAQRLRAGYR